MSKIVIDARIIKTTTGRYIERLLHYLQHQDYQNEYVVLLRNKKDWQPKSENFKTIAAPIEDFSFAEQIRLKKIIAGLKPDLVHFPMPQFPLLYRGKRVSTVHDLTMLNFKHRHWNPFTDGLKRAVFKLVLKRAVTKADRVITPSRYVKKELVKNYKADPANIKVTYESADDLAAHPKEYRPLKGKKFIFYVGNMFPHKNIERLLQAFDLLHQTHPDIHLALVGKRKRFHDELEALVTHDGIKNVHFTGFMPDAQLAWMYANARAYVFPSLSEGFGLPGLEAMRHNCAVISSKATCLPEIYKDAAYYFNPTDVEDIAQAIGSVLDDANLRKQLILRGKKRVKLFSWDTMAQETLDIYREALKK